MFLVKLYHYSKGLFYTLIVLLLLFLYINFKWGVVATPIYQYGMFSNAWYNAGPYPAYTVELNRHTYQLSNLPFPVRDQCVVIFSRYLSLEANNQWAIKAMLPLYGTSFNSDDVIAGRVSAEVFSKWFEQWLGKVTGEQVNSLIIYRSMVSWKDGVHVISSPEKVYPIVQ